jgi:hypothetical protein
MRKQVDEENDNFDFMQSAFTSETARFVLKLEDFGVLWRYFTRIFCHSFLTKLAPEFESALIAFMDDRQNLEVVSDFLIATPGEITEILCNAPEELARPLPALMDLVFRGIDGEKLIGFVLHLVEAMRQQIASWRVLPQFGRTILSYLKYHSSPQIAVPLLNFLEQFYAQTSSPVALENVDLAPQFASLGILSQHIGTPELIRFLTQNAAKIISSSVNQRALARLVLRIAPEQASLLGKPTPDLFASAISECESESEALAILATDEQVNRFGHDLFLKFPRATLLRLLTSPDAGYRRSTESACYALFPGVPGFGDYVPIEEVGSSDEPPTRSGDEARSIPETAKPPMIRLLDIGTSYLQENFAKSCVSLIRVLHWLRLCVGRSSLDCFGDLLLLCNGRENELAELLRLIASSATPDEVCEFALGNDDRVAALFDPLSGRPIARFFFLVDAFRGPPLLDLLCERDSFQAHLRFVLANDAVSVLTELIMIPEVSACQEFVVSCWRNADLILNSQNLFTILQNPDLGKSVVRLIIAAFLEHPHDPETVAFVLDLVHAQGFEYSHDIKTAMVAKQFLSVPECEIAVFAELFGRSREFAGDVLAEAVKIVEAGENGLTRIWGICRAIGTADCYAQIVAIMCNDVRFLAAKAANPEAETVIKGLCDLLETEEFAVHSNWCFALFTRVADMTEVPSKPVREFMKVFGEKADAADVITMLERFRESLNHPENGIEFAIAAQLVSALVSKSRELEKAFFVDLALDQKVFEKWPAVLGQLKSRFQELHEKNSH